MSSLAEVQRILSDAVNGKKVGGHGNWWEGLSREQFVGHKIFEQKVVEVGNPDDSVLVHALEGTHNFARPMPIGFPPVPKDKIDIIRRWIKDGCPG